MRVATLFVALAAPGDDCLVRIDRVRGKVAFASIVEIAKPSPVRVEPPCPYFGRCGGCDFQQMSYATQLETKISMLRDCLMRIGKIEFDREIPMIPSPRPFQYRSRARWHVDRNARKIGYFKNDSHEVIDVAQCLVLTTEMESAFESLRSSVNWADCSRTKSTGWRSCPASAVIPPARSPRSHSIDGRRSSRRIRFGCIAACSGFAAIRGRPRVRNCYGTSPVRSCLASSPGCSIRR